MSVWLEVSSCVGTEPSINLDDSIIRQVSALSTLMSAARQANSGKQALTWEYSLKVTDVEAQQIRNVVAFKDSSEDERSVILSVPVGYCNSCYVLRLFFEKSQ